MALLDLWKVNRKELEGKHIQQIISIAGSGKLQDGGDTSAQFRDFLSHVPSGMLERYAQQCLADKFDGSGFALQDIVNEIGRRLGFRVENGRYRGTSGQSGHDGIWRSAEGHNMIVEVKTTDAYRIDLGGIAEYRRLLAHDAKVSEIGCSILIVVGREDTGDLEAQIRGSRHAWDMRLISVEGLLRLMRLKEEVEDPQMLSKISGILLPQEFTKVDGIIDLVFSAAEEVRQDEEAEGDQQIEVGARGDRKPKFIPVKFHDACATRIQAHLKHALVRQSRSSYSTPDGRVSVICAVSREHRAATKSYWFAFHPHQRQRLAQASEAYVALGCGSEATIVLIPFREFEKWLDGMNTTHRNDRFYWHVSIFREGNKLVLHRKKGFGKTDLTRYLLPH
jgi:hypothetical protein